MKHQNDIKRYYDTRTQNTPVHLNVGGADFVVGRDTLQSIKGSLLAEMFKRKEHQGQTKYDKVFLDREPDIFAYVIKYLRSQRQFFPYDINYDLTE